MLIPIYAMSISMSSDTDYVTSASVPMTTSISVITIIVTTIISHMAALSLVAAVSTYLITSLSLPLFDPILTLTLVRVSPKTSALLLLTSVEYVVKSCM